MKPMMSKRFIGFLFLLVLLTACASTPALPDPTTEPLPAPLPTIVATDIPKQQELVFVEFFAIT